MPPLVVGDVFRNAARAVPDRVAAVIGERSLNFGQIDRVAVLAATDLAVVVTFAALAKLGAIFVPLNPVLGEVELAPIRDAARPVTTLDPASAPERFLARESERGVDPAIAETEPHVVFFTSGSTGRPKGAVLSHRVNVLRTHPGSQFEPRGVNVCMFPLFHMAGWTIALSQWQARDAVVFVPADPVAITAAVERHQATRLNCIPLVWRRILDAVANGRVGADALRSLRFADTGTSATPPELLAAIRTLVPEATVRVFYGSTEAGNVASLEMADFDRKPGRVGVPSLLTRTRLTDTGELEVTGPLLFDGYFDDPDATRDALVDGWYRTGDLAELDDGGFITITGRERAVIRTGGETVASTEVEAVLRDHSAVADIAVVGLVDPDYGEVVCAAVVLEGDATVTLDELRRFGAERLAGYKLPRRLEPVDEIPRTPATGQIQRHLLAERLAGL